jgi:hypothetical protein
VDGMFSLHISHIQKFAWPFFGHVILFDKVRCSHIKKKNFDLRRTACSLSCGSSVCPRITFPAPPVNLVSRNLEQH